MARKRAPLLGTWPGVEMTDMADNYLDLTFNPRIKIMRKRDDIYKGEFSFGEQTGKIYDMLRQDYGEHPCFIFNFDGQDESDQIFGAGIMRLLSDRSLVGEWIYHDGDVPHVECRW